MNFVLNDYHRNVTDKELIEDLQNVAAIINQNTVTIDDYNEYGRFHARTLTRRFGSWFTCLTLAGLVPSRSKIGISDEELFEEIEKVWIQLGKQPSYAQMRDISKYSIGTYEKRFGGWRNALVAFVDYINGTADNPQNLESPSCNSVENVHKTSRSINLRTRFLVLHRDNFKCCICGASPAKNPEIVLHIDHIKPWSKGGETIIDNLQTLCSECNLGKSDLV